MVERERERSKQFKRKIMRDRKKRDWKSREIERRKNHESSRGSAWDLGNRIH